MKRLYIFVVAFFLTLLPIKPVFAQEDYVINSFKSDILLQKNTSLLVKETIITDFSYPKHGIFRSIPVSYKVGGKNINADFEVISVTNERGSDYPFEKSRSGQYIKLKIGDPNETIIGVHSYVISYVIDDVVIRYPDHDEIYWNVTGSEWDTEILEAESYVSSPYAKITRVECFAGNFGTNEKFCQESYDENSADFSSTTSLGTERDFTIVVALNKNNDLAFPSRTSSFLETLFDNWGYIVSVLPFLFIFYYWYKGGRDTKFIGENVYYDEGKGKMTKPLLVREHLPMVYYPIQELSPSELGTIIDEKVDIDDVIAEIVELARLGYLKIEKLKTKKLIFNSTDYRFVKLEKDTSDLAKYQVYLLVKIFDEESIVLLSKLKNKFYVHLEEFKKKLYTSLSDETIFDGAPDKIRAKWIGIYIVFLVFVVFALVSAFNSTGNFYPFVVLGILSIPGFFIANSMPRRTARGYSFYRQIKGLDFYLQKGKWREEVAEKQMFFSEMLPIAIALGIVTKLAGDMQDLGIEPPDYFTGVTANTLAMDIGNFTQSSSSNLSSMPGGKGGSWSGGSGFSGGSSGGGFGGGGGGSW